MEPDSEGHRIPRRQRPPSSYGSMRTESDVEDEELMELPVEEEEEEEKKKGGNRGEVAKACPVLSPAPRPSSEIHGGTRLQMVRSGSPETVFTSTTLNTKPPWAVVIDTRVPGGREYAEGAEEEMDEELVTHSPEPPEPVSLDELSSQTDESSQLGRLHPEQEMPHIFKCTQQILGELTDDDFYKFKLRFCQWERRVALKQVMEGDVLDFVDKILEVLGQDRALQHTVDSLEGVGKKEEAGKLQNLCQRAWSRLHMKQHLIKKHKVIREGIVRPGKQNLLDAIYVEPLISTRAYGGVAPAHELRPQLPSPLQVPGSDTLVGLNDLFALRRDDDGRPVRSVVTSGLPGVGLSVCVGKLSLDWAEERANKDMQVVIQLPFGSLWTLRSKNSPMSVVDLVEHFYPECRGINFLHEPDCKFLLVMDSFDCYQAALDWKKAPVVDDCLTKAPLDVLIVNIIRGTMLPNACLWILGRAAAVSQIPAELVDAVTEIQGFSDQMKDRYLIKRFHDASLATSIVEHYRRLPTLAALAQHPFVCWMVATVFERCFMYQGYGAHPPRLTPFYVTILVIQANRRLEFYHGKGRAEHNLVWPAEDKQLLTNMGKMAFQMLQQSSSVFSEENMRECGLDPTEVTVRCGLCTELPAAASGGGRRFSFIHLTFQEFMAALYVYTMFHGRSQNVLNPGRTERSSDQARLAADLIQSALDLTLSSRPGQYDMFLRFLCGLFSPECHVTQLSVCLLGCKEVKLSGLDKLQQLLEQRIRQTAEGEHRDRVANLRECLREMTQTDE